MRSSRHLSAVLLVLALIATTPLLSGCLTRSTTVGDRLSGEIIVATSPDNPRGAPQIDVPQSMASRISVSEYKVGPKVEGSDANPSAGAAPSEPPETTSAAPSAAAAGTDDQQTPTPENLIGTRATYSDLTAGQFSQLGDMVSAAFSDSSMSMDLSATRSGDVVRVRGGTDLTDLTAGRDYIQLTVSFAGPVTATNGEQTGENSVTWTPEPGKSTDFSADATYADPATAAVSSWSWFLAVVCLLVVLLIVWLAYNRRDSSPRPGRTVKTPESSTKG